MTRPLLPRRALHLALLASTTLTTPALVTPALAQDVIELEPINVEGSSYETEGTNSYTTNLISVGEKAAMTPREVPQSTSVVTRKQIEDGGYGALEEALADTPGIMILSNDSGRSSIYSRGYEFDYLYFDGLPAPVSSIYGTQPDLSIVDHVEVLKGPAGLFIGTGEPAGSINMRLKQATSVDPTGYASASVDSNGHTRTELDYSSALNEEGTIRGRAVLAYADGDGFVDRQENGVLSAYGTVAWDITPDTTLTFSLAHMERDIAPFNGLPTYADGSLMWLDESTSSGADWNYFENATTDAVLALEHHFANGVRAKASLRASHQEADFLYAYTGAAADADNVVSRMSWLGQDWEQDSLALDAHVEMPFLMANMDSNLILGADWQKLDSSTYGLRGAANGSWDLDTDDTASLPRPAEDYTTLEERDITSTGLYAQLRVKPSDRLTLIGGARVSWYDGDVRSGTIGTARDLDSTDIDAKVTPFAGLTYELSPAATLYASYSEIFIPQFELDVNGDTLDPLEGRQYELGVKGELAYGLNYSAALFDLRQVNRSVAVRGTDYAEPEGDVRSRGFETEVSGEVIPNLHLSAGYTYTETEYLEGPDAGAVFSTYTPEHMLKLTALYDVTEGPMQGWSFGGRLTSMSEFSSRGITAPAYNVVDLMAAKDLGQNTMLRLGVDNAFDEDYYSRVGSNVVFNFRGAPRTFNMSLTKSF